MGLGRQFGPVNFTLARCLGLVFRAGTFGGVFKQPSGLGIDADLAPLFVLLQVERVAQAAPDALALQFLLRDFARVPTVAR